MTTLNSRLDALERDNRRYRRVLTLILLAFGAFLTIGAATQDHPAKIQAKTLEIVDESRNVLVRIGSRNGQGAISTYSPSGQLLADIVPTLNGSGSVVLYDGKGKQNLALTDMSRGGGSIKVNNSKGATCLILSRNTDDDGSIQVNNVNGSGVLQATADTSGVGALIAIDSSGKQVARFPAGAH